MGKVCKVECVGPTVPGCRGNHAHSYQWHSDIDGMRDVERHDVNVIFVSDN